MPIVAHPLATDPLRNFKFKATITKPDIPGMIDIGFSAISGLNVTTSVIPYREGGQNTTTRKMPGQSDFGDVTFRRGLIVGNGPLWGWYLEIFSAIQGQGRGFAGNDFRTDIVLNVFDHPITQGDPQVTKARFRMFNAWPSSIQYGDLDAGGNDILMEQLTVVHEGFTIELGSAGAGGI